MKVFLSEIFGIICVSVTHSYYSHQWHDSDLYWACLIWAENRFTFGCVAAIVNSWQSYVCTQCRCQHDSSLTWALQNLTAISTNFLNLHLEKQHWPSHHTAQPRCMYHKTRPCKAGVWADAAVGLPTCWQNVQGFICSPWRSGVPPLSSCFLSTLVGVILVIVMWQQNKYSACDIWWWWSINQLFRGYIKCQDHAFCSVMLACEESQSCGTLLKIPVKLSCFHFYNPARCWGNR